MKKAGTRTPPQEIQGKQKHENAGSQLKIGWDVYTSVGWLLETGTALCQLYGAALRIHNTSCQRN
jgi:hypothetical protein